MEDKPLFKRVRQGRKVTLVLNKDVDDENESIEAITQMKEAIREDQFDELVIDCSQHKVFSTVLLGGLVGCFKAVTMKGGLFYLSGVCSQMKHQLEITHLSRILPVVDEDSTEEDI